MLMYLNDCSILASCSTENGVRSLFSVHLDRYSLVSVGMKDILERSFPHTAMVTICDGHYTTLSCSRLLQQQQQEDIRPPDRPGRFGL